MSLIPKKIRSSKDITVAGCRKTSLLQRLLGVKEAERCYYKGVLKNYEKHLSDHRDQLRLLQYAGETDAALTAYIMWECRFGRQILQVASKDNYYEVTSLFVEKYAVEIYHESVYRGFCRGKPRNCIWAKIKRNDDLVWLYIEDIQVTSRNTGLGSLLLFQLEQYAAKIGATKITGTLTLEDVKDHGARLIHFYNKNAYQVHYDSEGVPHSVSKHL